jgi:catechol 2,3-dioxygenase-like lactoylglutathione lyase family enzyme
MADDVNVTVTSCVMRVSNLDRSVQFYCDIFSCRVAVRSDDIALLLTPKGFQIYLHLKDEAAPRGIGTLGVQHLVWSTDSRSDLEQITERIAAYDPATYLHVDDATGLTFVDACGPDSERIIITYPGPGELPRTAIAERLRD